jgi:hypothetical protein
LQQSVATAHELPAPLQVLTDEVHLDVTGSQDFEQHWPSDVHVSPDTPQVTFCPPIPGVPESPLTPAVPPVPVEPPPVPPVAAPSWGEPEPPPHEQPGRAAEKTSNVATRRSRACIFMLVPFRGW